jgi:AcrR family transcriptional regulator
MERLSTPDPRSRARDARALLYRELICEAAERRFADSGVDDTKMEDVAREAGLSIATVYTVFAGKAEIVRCVHARRLPALVRLAVEQVDAPHPADICLRTALRGAIHYFTEHSAYLMMHLRQGYAWCMSDAVAASSEDGAAAWGPGVAAIGAIIERGIAEGAFGGGNARRLARAAIALQQLHLVEWVEDGLRREADAVFEDYWNELLRLLRPSVDRAADSGSAGPGEETA